MPLEKEMLFVQSYSVNLSTKNRVLFFAENWNLKVKAVFAGFIHTISTALKRALI